MTGPTGLECGGIGDDSLSDAVGDNIDAITSGLDRFLTQLGPPPGWRPEIPKHLPVITGLRLQADGEAETIRLGDRHISLQDAQRVGFVPTAEIIAEDGLVGVGQYVRAAETEEIPVGDANTLPEGYTTKEEMAAGLGIHSLSQQQLQGEIN